MKKYYEILEVHPKASREIIKKAYQVLVKKYHPDLYEGEEKIEAEKKTKDITEAYKILSDEFLREQYDLELEKDNKNIKTFNSTRKESRNNVEKNKDRINEKNNYEEEKTYGKNSVGTLMGLFSVTKALVQNKPRIKSIKEIEKEDYIAAGLTLLIMLVVGIILWFIPITNNFMRTILPFV